MRKALVLLSGGQDSTTALFWARTMFDEVLAVSVFYGQRHAAELAAAARIAHDAGVAHMELEAPALGRIGGSALVDASKTISSSGGMRDVHAPNGLPTSYVPGRNLLFLTLAGTLAVVRDTQDIVTGVCQTDYSGYPDCRREFIDSMEATLTLAMPSGSGPLRIHTPLMFMTKAETVKLARRLPGCWEALAHSVTCYHGVAGGCAVAAPWSCPACTLRARGFAEAGETDPAVRS